MKIHLKVVMVTSTALILFLSAFFVWVFTYTMGKDAITDLSSLYRESKAEMSVQQVQLLLNQTVKLSQSILSQCKLGVIDLFNVTSTASSLSGFAENNPWVTYVAVGKVGNTENAKNVLSPCGFVSEPRQIKEKKRKGGNVAHFKVAFACTCYSKLIAPIYYNSPAASPVM